MNEETLRVWEGQGIALSYPLARPAAPRLIPVRAGEMPGGEGAPGAPQSAPPARRAARSAPRVLQPDRETVLRLIEGIKVL